MDASASVARSKRTRWIALGIAAIAIVGALVVTVALVSSSTSAPTASPTDVPVTADSEEDISEEPIAAVPSPTAAPLSDDEDAETVRAEAAVSAIVAAGDEISQRADGSAVGVDAIATGWALGELQSRAREQYDLGYTQTGEATITSVTTTAVDLKAAPATITLKVCVDVSEIDVIDAAGNSLKDSLYNPGHPVAHIYGAVFQDDTWKISTHEIPDSQDCAAA